MSNEQQDEGARDIQAARDAVVEAAEALIEVCRSPAADGPKTAALRYAVDKLHSISKPQGITAASEVDDLLREYHAKAVLKAANPWFLVEGVDLQVASAAVAEAGVSTPVGLSHLKGETVTVWPDDDGMTESELEECRAQQLYKLGVLKGVSPSTWNRDVLEGWWNAPFEPEEDDAQPAADGPKWTGPVNW